MLTSDPALFASETWQRVGRTEPLFGDRGLPLDDPTISREQLRVRWSAERRAFEIEPCPGARRRVHVFRPDTPGASLLEHRTFAAPGTCVAIGERAILALEVVRPRGRDEDRMGLVGESDVMWALRDEIRDVAAFGRPALVTGPTGAGKELVASAIHAQGPHARGPFVAVNCGALAENLVESTLFGHARGAFTGADRAADGCFVAANGGTLFLDEVGELPLSLQPKLLRVLQDSVVVPVGSTEHRRVSCRVVTATNKDLRMEVAAGRMREDFYQRIAAHVVCVPPIEARRLDVPELFARFLARLADTYAELAWPIAPEDRWRPAIPQDVFVGLMRRRWPGNVRELENYAEQVARLNRRPGAFRAPEIAVASEPAPSGPTRASAEPEGLAEVAAALGLAARTVSKLLDEERLRRANEALASGPADARFERLRPIAAAAVFERLSEMEFNQTRVAEALGASRTTLVKLMRDLGLRRATDLSWEQIAAALSAEAGDVDRAAQALMVPSAALKKQITLLRPR